MEYRDILYETDGRLAYITLNRPEKLNALSNNLRGEVMDAMREAEHDDDVGVIVLKANGRSFSAGYDLSPARGPGTTTTSAIALNCRKQAPPTRVRHNGPAMW